jgi:hypothetical protein
MNDSLALQSNRDSYWDPNRLTLWMLPHNAINGEWTDYEVKSDAGETIISGKLPYDIDEVRSACTMFHDRVRGEATFSNLMHVLHKLPLSKQERVAALEKALAVVREEKEPAA